MSREQDRRRKLQRKAKKAAKRREHDRRNVAAPATSSSVVRALEEVDDLIADGEDGEALEVLEELGRRYPRQVEVLLRLAEAYIQAGNLWAYQATCERLTVVDPDSPGSWLALVAAALGNMQPAVAERALSHLTRTWPDMSEAAEARKTLEGLREFLAQECRRRGLDEETGFRVLLLNDELNLHLNLGKYEKVCETATRVLAICPTFAPALNNRCEAYFRAGRYAEAIADSRRVLEFEPTNYHALANLARHLYLAGRFDEVPAAAAELKACAADANDADLKKAETFAILGDWEAVRRAVDHGRSRWGRDVPDLAEHLAGVALANLGDLDGARRCWRRAAGGTASVAWAQENLEDSQQPIGRRHGPWAFPVDHWIPRSVLVGFAEGGASARSAGGMTKVVRRQFEQFPQLELLADAVLERSNPVACKTLIQLAKVSKRPLLLAAIKKFALGRRGSDELRMDATLALSQAGYLEGQVETWREGKLAPVELVTQEITREPMGKMAPEIRETFAEAHQAILDGRGAVAERLLDKCLQLQPDDVPVQFNRAVAIRMQGRDDEALEIVQRIHRDRPDYVFARMHLAERCIEKKDFQEAQLLLAPLARKARLHISEYTGWCAMNVQLALAMGEPERAKSLLGTWEKMEPDDERIEVLKDRIRRTEGVRGYLSRILGRKK